MFECSLVLLTNLHNPLFNGAFDDISCDVNWLVLPQSMDTVDRLLFDGFIPPSVHQKYICASRSVCLIRIIFWLPLYSQLAIVKLRPTPPALRDISKISGSSVFWPNSSMVLARCAWLIVPSNRLWLVISLILKVYSKPAYSRRIPCLVSVVSIKSTSNQRLPVRPHDKFPT